MLILTGALTSKPYAFTARPWELRSVQSVDVLDGIGSNIRIDFKESEILRILPRRNSEINESWISDKIRFFYDGLKRQRLTSPYLKHEGNLKKVKWKSILAKYSSLLKVYSTEYGSSQIGVVVSPNLDLETFFSVKSFTMNFGFSLLGMDRGLNFNLDDPSSYCFQNKLQDFENVDYCLFVGTNPRFEASVLNLRLRKLFRRGDIKFDSIGGTFATTYPVNFWGLTSTTLLEVVEGKHPLCKSLAKAKNPLLIYGSKIMERYDSLALSGLFQNLKSNFSIVHQKTLVLNPLQTDSNSVGGFELGIRSLNPDSLKKLKLLYYVGEGNKNFFSKLFSTSSNPLLVCQTSHGDSNLNNADLVFPSTTFVEKTATYYNVEGRPQKTQKALLGPLLSRDDWKIFNILYTCLSKSALYATKPQLLTQCSKILPSSDFASTWFSSVKVNLSSSFFFCLGWKEKVLKTSFKLFIEDFYMTNTYCTSSRVMAKASESLRSYTNNYKFLNFLSFKTK